MVDVVSSEAGIPRPDHPLNQSGGAKWFLPAFGVLVLVGVIYVGYALSQDLAVAKTVPWILLGIADCAGRLARRAVVMMTYSRSKKRYGPGGKDGLVSGIA